MMKIRGKDFTITQLICLALYYGLAKHLPSSINPIFGGVSKNIRYQLVRRIFKRCGKFVNVEHGVVFGRGTDIYIGDNSGIGVNACIPSNTVIGNNVMMGPNCYIFSNNHAFGRIDVPMCKQGNTERQQTIIEDDVWIGRNVLITPGRRIKKGSIVAAGCVLCKDFPEYSIVGGNPSKLIKSRLNDDTVKE